MTRPPSRRRLEAGWARVGLATVVLFALAVAAAPGARAQKTKAETRDRHVFVTALDRNDIPVTDLKVNEVVVKEDGATREVVNVTRATAPMQITLLIDDSQATQAMTGEVRESASAFVNLVMKNSPDSEMSVWTFGERPTRLVDFTTSAPVLTRAIGGIFPRPGSGAYVMEALVNVSTALKTRGATRPVVVVFLAEEGPEFSTSTEATVTYGLRNAGATLWTIVLQARPEPPSGKGGQAAQSPAPERRDRDLVLADDAVASGGGTKVILDRMSLDSAFVSIASRLTSQVDIAYARPDRLVPPKKLEVTVTRPGVRVQAPRWAGQ
jgi:VWFA-related protein